MSSIAIIYYFEGFLDTNLTDLTHGYLMLSYTYLYISKNEVIITKLYLNTEQNDRAPICYAWEWNPHDIAKIT